MVVARLQKNDVAPVRVMWKNIKKTILNHDFPCKKKLVLSKLNHQFLIKSYCILLLWIICPITLW